jgi:hypothetical protein
LVLPDRATRQPRHDLGESLVVAVTAAGPDSIAPVTRRIRTPLECKLTS